MDKHDHLFFRQYEPSSSYTSIVEVRKDNSCIKLIDYLDYLYNVMPRDFIITTKGGSYRFNTEFLTDVCLTIKESLQTNPDLKTFEINIKDKNNVMQKIEQMFLGKEIIFNENDISALQKITKALKLLRCPNFMKPESLRTNQDTYSLLKSNKSYSLNVPVSFNSQSVINFFKDTNTNSFKIKTKNNEYNCNNVSVLLSEVIYDKKQEDPSLNEFFYDFDDEFNEFNEISSFFNFNSIQITPNNMNSLKNIAEDLKINCILPRINDFINQYEQNIQKVDDIRILIEPVDQLFEWLYQIKKLSPKTVSDLIIESIWIHTEENVQELAAIILQVILSGFVLHPYIYELLILLDKSFDAKTNNLNILLPFITQKLLFLFGQTRCICAFVYMLYKKGWITKEDLIKKIASGYEKIDHKISYGHLSNDSLFYDFQSNENVDNDFCSNVILWYFPELLEIRQFSMNSANKILDENQKNFINFYYPNNIDKFNKMRDSGEPDDEITKSLIHDDVDTLQSIISNNKINIKKVNIAFNIFDSFINQKDMTYLNYSATYGSIKCFKYLLLNHASIDSSTFQYAIFGGNVEIIRIVEQQNYDVINQLKSNSSNNLILPAIRNHYNDIFDWIIQQVCANKSNTNGFLSQLILSSVLNGNTHAFIECINNGFDLSSSSKSLFHLMIKKSCECGFYRFTKLLFLFFDDLFDLNEKDTEVSRYVFKKIDFIMSSVVFGNLSIFKLIINKMNKDLRKNIQKAFMIAVQLNNINIIKYICETEKFAALLKNNKSFSIHDHLNLAIQKGEKNIFYYLLTQFPILNNVESVLTTACENHILEIVEYLTDFILKNNPNFDFSQIFVKAASGKSDDICQYFIDKGVNLDFSNILSSLSNVLKNEKMFFILIEIIDPNLKESFMFSSLQIAIKNKQYEIVEFLLKEKVNVCNALVEATENHDIDMINILLKYNSQPSYINRPFKKGTALNIASKLNDLSTVKRLLSIPGIDPNISDANNFTPLISAVFNLNLEIINCILNFYGDDIQQQMWQLDESIKQILKKLSNKHSADENARFGYIYEGFIKMMKNEDNSPNDIRKMVHILNRLLEIKNVNVNCYEGNVSILSFACKSNEINLVKLLLQHEQIDVNSYLSEKGDTPLMISILSDHLEIAELLIKFPKTNLNHRNYNDETALTIAAQKDLKEIVSLILSYDRFDPVESNIDYAFYLSSFSVAQLLFDIKDLDVNRCFIRNKKDGDKDESNKDEFKFVSKLVDAVYSSDIKMIDLISSHPSFDIHKSNAKSALFLAVSDDQIEIFRKIIKILNNKIYFSDQSILVCAAVNQSHSILNEILNNSEFDIEKLDIVGAFINSIQPSNEEKADMSIEITKKLFDFDKKNNHLIDLTKLVPFTKFSGSPRSCCRNSFFTLISTETENAAEFAHFFLDNGVDPNMPNEYGTYPLEHAMMIDSYELFHALIESGKIDFKIRMKNRMNQTFLHQAALCENHQFLNELLNINLIDVNAVDDDGNTPLILAVKTMRSNNINLLFKCENLDYLKENNDGVNALKLAESSTPRHLKHSKNIDESLSKDEILFRLHLIMTKNYHDYSD